jgi:hypothetical protein
MSTTAFEENQLTWLSSLKALQSNQLISSNTQKLLQELRSTDVNINRICDLLASEPALTAKILMITNSAFYGYPREISDIEEAVVLMGAVQLSNIIYTSVAIVQSDNPLLKKYVKHVLLCAFFSKKIADRLAIATQSIYISGLLHLLPVILNFRTDIDRMLTPSLLTRANQVVLKKLNLPDVVLITIRNLFNLKATQSEALCLRFGFNLSILAAGRDMAPFPYLISVESDFNRLGIKPNEIASMLFETQSEQKKLLQMVM